MNNEPTKWLQLMVQLSSQKRWDEVISSCTEVIQHASGPVKADAYYLRGRAYRAKKRHDLAIEDCAKAIELDPHHVKAYIERGFAYWVERKYALALADHSRAIELAPSDVEAHIERGWVYHSKGEHELAERDFSRAIELSPQNADAYIGLGWAYYAQKKHDDAVASIVKATVIEPDNVRAHLQLGFVYQNAKRDYQLAVQSYSKALRLDKRNVNAYLGRGFSRHAMGEYDPAIADYSEAVALAPDNVSAYIERGIVYRNGGDLAAAMKDGQKVMRLAPQNAWAYFLCGEGYFFQKKYTLSLKHHAKAGELNGKFIAKFARVYIAGKISAFEMGDEQQAEAFRLCYNLVVAAYKVQLKLFKPAGGYEIAHYTSLDTLKALADNKPFRLYNVAYMNDPEEGRTFFKIMEGEGVDVEGVFYKDASQGTRLSPAYESASQGARLSPAYIGSFVNATQQEGQKDNLFSWRTYGKHNGDEAAGACLIFGSEQFADSMTDMQFGGMLGLPEMSVGNRSDSSVEMPTSSTSVPSAKAWSPAPLFEVAYKGKAKAMDDLLEELAASIKQVQEFLQQSAPENSKPKLITLVREVLDSVRFLFKANDYQEEHEVRVIRMLYPVSTENQPERKIDMERIPPRFYLELPNTRLNEVILSPKEKRYEEWEYWLKQKSKLGKTTITKSKIKYGEHR